MARPDQALQIETDDDAWVIHVPETAIDPIATVVAIDVESMPKLVK